VTILVAGCSPLKMASTINNGNIKDYKYLYISPTEALIMEDDDSVNPRDVVAGIMSKEGFVILQELRPDFIDETLIASYGESGIREGVFSSAIEVTIQFTSARTRALIASCTAEGRGSSRADDIREAIMRSLSAVLAK